MSLALLQRDMIAWLRSGDPADAERIGGGPGPAIYLNNHRAALIASLGGNYELLRRWLGDEAFEGFAAHHAEACPPTSWTLDAYGADFHATLARLAPDAPTLAEIARLEWALGQAFVAPEAEPLTIAALGAVDWDSATLRLVPSAAILTLATNADLILAALASGEAVPEAELLPDPATVLIWRADFVPRFRRAEPDEAELIAALASGVTFAALCETLVAAHGEQAGITAAGQILARWAGDEFCQVGA